MDKVCPQMDRVEFCKTVDEDPKRVNKTILCVHPITTSTHRTERGVLSMYLPTIDNHA